MQKKGSFHLNAYDVHVQAVNIQWRSPCTETIKEKYILSVSSRNSLPQTLLLNESCYEFSAPEIDQPCEVYNFSVTTTYVGATYTGGGCSLSTLVLSKMLPSLPDTAKFESSLTYSLEKQVLGSTTLTLHTVSIQNLI